MHTNENYEDVATAWWFENFYECTECGTKWTDELVLHVR